MAEMLVAAEGEHSSELECRVTPVFEKSPSIEVPENLDQRRHHPGPTGLMTSADAGTVVAVKIFIEQ
jgi:hypothetical protein